jgi:hypothetical protein
MEWYFPEYEQYRRPRRWYLVMGTIAGILVLIGLLSRNFLFVVILVLATFIVFAREAQPPRRVRVALTDRGVDVGRDNLPYSTLDYFWIVYDPPQVKKLFLQDKSAIRPPLAISLEDRNPVKVREILGQFLKEDLDQEEPGVDQVGRSLRIS